jgi:hypothetical protein
MSCININHPEFIALKEKSKLDILELELKINKFQKENNTDEFPSIEDLKSATTGTANLAEVNYALKAVSILQSDKAKQVFDKGKKSNWDLNKILTELAIPKEQKQLLIELGITDREQLALELASTYSYTIEINTAKEKTIGNDNPTYTVNGVQYVKFGENDYRKRTQNSQFEKISKKEFEDNQNKPTQIYSNLTVPGGTNYTEQEIATPAITPSIKGHAEFATDKGIGWFRSDNKAPIVEGFAENKEAPSEWGLEDSVMKQEPKTRRILEVQSDLFQKGRDKKLLTGEYSKLPIGGKVNYKGKVYEITDKYDKGDFKLYDLTDGNETITGLKANEFIDIAETTQKNQFLQLLNKDNNWVTFFVKSIIQDSAKKGYEKILFPTGNTASKVEGHTTLEEFKKQKELQIQELESAKKLTGFIAEIYGEDGHEFRKFDSKEELDNFIERNSGWKILDKTQNFDREINQLKQELERVETEGFGALKPIFNFYENTVSNILNKTYGKENVKLITDEYGNTWNEVEITPEVKNKDIYLQRPSVKRTPSPIEKEIFNIGRRYNMSNSGFISSTADSNAIRRDLKNKGLENTVEVRQVNRVDNKSWFFVFNDNGKTSMFNPSKYSSFQIEDKLEFKERNEDVDSAMKIFFNMYDIEYTSVEDTYFEGELLGTIAMASVISKTVKVVENKARLDTLPEEAAHFYVELLAEDTILQKMMKDIVNLPIYDEVFKDYYEVYKGDEEKLKKEAIGKMIAQHIVKQVTGETSDMITESWWNYIWSKIKELFGVNNPYKESANEILDSTLSRLPEINKSIAEPKGENIITPRKPVENYTKNNQLETAGEIDDLIYNFDEYFPEYSYLSDEEKSNFVELVNDGKIKITCKI